MSNIMIQYQLISENKYDKIRQNKTLFDKKDYMGNSNTRNRRSRDSLCFSPPQRGGCL